MSTGPSYSGEAVSGAWGYDKVALAITEVQEAVPCARRYGGVMEPIARIRSTGHEAKDYSSIGWDTSHQRRTLHQHGQPKPRWGTHGTD